MFIAQIVYLLPLTVRKYRRETLDRMIDLAWGRGSLIVDGGVISVLVILGIAIGGMVAIEAWATLNMMGFGALSGIIGGLANVREMGPLVAGIAFAAQCGCRMTAEIGSMRIAEEIDATEAMGLRPIPFVVGTRLVGGLLCVIPGYALTLLTSFFVSNIMIRGFYHATGGTYDHYFVQFLSPVDLVYSTVKAAVFCCRGDNNSLLLRLFRIGRPSRCGPSVRACGASEPGGGHGAGLRADGIAVGTSTNVCVQRVDG